MRRLIVDGYNVVHAWPHLKMLLVERGLEEARRRLVQDLAEHAAHTGVAITVVFDAHSRDPHVGQSETVEGVRVVYGSKLASADHVIERLANESARRDAAADVAVVTEDRLQRALVSAMGVATVSASSLLDDLRRDREEVSAEARRRSDDAHRSRRIDQHLPSDVAQRLERLRRGEDPSADEQAPYR